MINLNHLIPPDFECHLTNAAAINDKGEIAATAFWPSYSVRTEGFLLSPLLKLRVWRFPQGISLLLYPPPGLVIQEESEDLVHWTPLRTNQMTFSTFSIFVEYSKSRSFHRFRLSSPP